MDWLDYREKLGIGFYDEEKVQYFMTKMFNFLEGLSNENMGLISEHEYFLFCDITGTKKQIIEDYARDNYRLDLVIGTLRKHSKSLEDFLTYYIAFINCQSEFKDKKTGSEEYKNLLCNKLSESHLQYEVLKDDDGYFIFPQGAKEFDDALVSEPLHWLEKFPLTRKVYVIALRQYQEGKYIRDIADNLRKSLETFLQEFLENGKNLDNNSTEIFKYLGKENIDSAIPGFFQSLTNTYKNINDRCAKHNDYVDPRLLEFLLYQTGILIRMLIVIRETNRKDND